MSLFDDVSHDLLKEQICPDVMIALEEAPDTLGKMFETSEINKALRRSKSTVTPAMLKVAVLGRDLDEEEMQDLVAKRNYRNRPVEPPAELEKLAKGASDSIKKACGAVDHSCRKSSSVTEALERLIDIFSDRFNTEQLSLVRKAKNSLDIPAFVSVLGEVFEQPL